MVIPDHRNSVAATIDMDTHSVYRLARYTPEGLLTVLEDDGTVICAEGADLTVNCKGPDMPFAFNGMWRSEVSGLSYMRNRWYSPHLAQFMSHDPLEYIDSYNLYAFASLDPINFWDPWGLGADGLVNQKPKPKPEPKQVVDEPYFPDFSTLEPGGNPDDMPSNVKIDRQILGKIESLQNANFEIAGEILQGADGKQRVVFVPRHLYPILRPGIGSLEAPEPPIIRNYVLSLNYGLDLLNPLARRVAYFHTHPEGSGPSGNDVYWMVNSAGNSATPVPILQLIVGVQNSRLYVPTNLSMEQLSELNRKVSNGESLFDQPVGGSLEGQIQGWYRGALIYPTKVDFHLRVYRVERGGSIFEVAK